MPYMTLADARTQVALYVDDRNNTRFTSTHIDGALKVGLARTMRDYVDRGGDRFEEELSVQPDSDGYIDLSSYDPLQVHAVAVLDNGYWIPIDAVDKVERGRTPNGVTGSTFREIIVRNPTLPTTTTHPLVGNGATALNSTFGIDSLICLRAAMQLSTYDKEPRPDLQALEDSQIIQLVSEQPVVTSRRYPSTTIGHGSTMRYCWDPVNQRIEICQAVIG